MDKIYSRKRIHIPRMEYQGQRNQPPKRVKKTIKTASILCVAVFVCYTILRSIEPVLDQLCTSKAKSVATMIANEEASKVMEKYSYDDIVTIHKDEVGNITMVGSNIIIMNEIISAVAAQIQKDLDEIDSQEVSIHLGTFTGSKILSGRGIKVPIRISSIGDVETDFKSEFQSAGINQTLHRVYLQLTCHVSILTPFHTIEEEITNQVILAENIIVGNIPQSYYHLEGMKQDQAVDIIE